MAVVRCILLCDEENLIVAGRAVQFLLHNPERKDAWLAYGKVEMHAKRLAKSISVRQVRP
jgi:hypothetical protein